MLANIQSHLPADFPWKESILYFDTIHSTNTAAKELAAKGAPHGTVLLANHQTGGRGRLGRSFHSPAGSGIYLSVILRFPCNAEALMHLTCATAVAVCDAIASASELRPGVKWTNDLVFGKQKLGGILTELSFRPNGQVDYAVVGIGINSTQKEKDFPQDIRSMATSLSLAVGHDLKRDMVAAKILIHLQKTMDTLLSNKDTIMQQYRQDCITIGSEICVCRADSVQYGVATGVDDNGALLVRFSDGHAEAVHTGEVSIRGMYGYI